MSNSAATATDAGAVVAPDIRTFYRSKQPKSDTHLSALVAYYYRFVCPPSDRKDAISGKDLTEAMRLIGNRELPKNPNLTLNNAKNAGYLDGAGSGLFKVNSVGENLVTMTLGGNGTDEATPSPKKKKPKRAVRPAKSVKPSK